MTVTALFLDSAGVLFDKDKLMAEWPPRIGEFLAQQLGGDTAAWTQANAMAQREAWRRYEQRMKKDGSRSGARAFIAQDRVRWLLDVCDAVGITPPADAAVLAEDSARSAGSRVDAALPGAADAVRALRERLTLFTSSSQPSLELAAQLRALGVRELFDRTYGPDLVDRWKSGPHYYEAILKDAIVRPEAAATVDDSPERLDWAKKAGLRTFVMTADPNGAGRHEAIGSLADLLTRL